MYRRNNDENFLESINKLDDSYKVYLFSIISAIFFFIFLISGINIDPDSIKQLALDKLVTSLGDEFVSSIWTNIFVPLLTIVGIIQVGLSIFSILKFGKTGIIISSFSFIGMLGLLYTTQGLPRETLAIWLPLIIIGWFFARKNSNLEFDTDGTVFLD